MIDFYNTYINTTSATRAKLTVQMFAKGTAESQKVISELLETLSQETSETKEAVRAALMQAEIRNDISRLRAYLADDLKLIRPPRRSPTASATTGMTQKSLKRQTA